MQRILVGLSLIAAFGCKQRDNGSQVMDSAVVTITGTSTGITTGNGDGPALNVTWNHGTQYCVNNTDPPIQTFQFDANTWILRENKCAGPVDPSAAANKSTYHISDSFEAPFIYLLFGSNKVLMLDSGSVSEAKYVPMRATVDQIISSWLAQNNQSSIQLILAHTHSHQDHIYGDGQFQGRPNTTIVGYGQDNVGQFFGFTDWQTSSATFDLGGGRVLDVLPIPGHLEDHIAIYDRQDALLLTGDTLYPGHLFINDWTTYQASIARLAAFVANRPVSYVLGAHIEAKNAPIPDQKHSSAPADRFYVYGETWQPDEHILELHKSLVLELNQAMIDAGPTPVSVFHDDFHIDPPGIDY